MKTFIIILLGVLILTSCAPMKYHQYQFDIEKTNGRVSTLDVAFSSRKKFPDVRIKKDSCLYVGKIKASCNIRSFVLILYHSEETQ